jgi:hypothetical protein
LRLEPLIGLPLRYFLGNPVAFLQAADKLISATGHEFQVVVREFAPLFLGGALQLFHFALHLVPIHMKTPLEGERGTNLSTVALGTNAGPSVDFSKAAVSVRQSAAMHFFPGAR